MASSSVLCCQVTSVSTAASAVLRRRSPLARSRVLAGKPARLQRSLVVRAADDHGDRMEPFATRGADREDFDWGHEDEHHTFKKSEEGIEKWKEYSEEGLRQAGWPSGFQGVLAWTFPEGLIVALWLNVEPLYILLWTAAMALLYCGSEMMKELPAASEAARKRGEEIDANLATQRAAIVAKGVSDFL
eukprot:jgi/Chlat1/8837/Chrsp91S08167